MDNVSPQDWNEDTETCSCTHHETRHSVIGAGSGVLVMCADCDCIEYVVNHGQR